MLAYLSYSDIGYFLDWNNNQLENKPLLYVNGKVTLNWSFIDILLDVFLSLPYKPTAIYIPPTINAKDKILNVYHTWRLVDSLDNETIWLDGKQLSLVNHNLSELKMGACTVVNIDWE